MHCVERFEDQHSDGVQEGCAHIILPGRKFTIWSQDGAGRDDRQQGYQRGRYAPE